jgi:aminocarboxymuconate-semialdehyde decarboxylase
MKIDIHAHIVDRRYLEELNDTLKLEAQHTGDGKTLFRHDGCTVAWSREDMFDIDERLRQMDRKEIDVRVLSLSTPNVYSWDEKEQIKVARDINDALARICRAHPDRFLGLASLPLGNIDASLAEIDRALNELGMKGVAIGSNIGGVALDDERFEPIWQRINSLFFSIRCFPRARISTATSCRCVWGLYSTPRLPPLVSFMQACSNVIPIFRTSWHIRAARF